MEEVFPGIFLIKQKGSFGHIKPPENIYILAGHNGIIYDAGYGNRKTVTKLIEELNEIKKVYEENSGVFELTRILVSHGHPDHFSGLKRIRKALGVKVVLTEKTAEIIRNKNNFGKSFNADNYKDHFIIKNGLGYRIRGFVQKLFSDFFFKRIYGLSFITDPDEIIAEKTKISINSEDWLIINSPGHAVDHISLYNEEKGVLLSGDNILNSMTTWLGPPNCNIEDYNNSIDAIRKLGNLKIILPAHGSVITHPKERLNEILEHRKKRTQQVLDLIQNSSNNGISSDEIIRSLYPAGKRMQIEIARGWVSLTIKMLESKNLVKRKEEKKKIKFYPVNSF